MKDQIITLIEAVRLSQAILAKHNASGGEQPVAALNELLRIFDDQSVRNAMNVLYPDIDSPSVSPGDAPDIRQSELNGPQRTFTRL
jgi:hypothetical protein